MQVEFLSGSEHVISTIVGLIKRCESMSWAVAWATENPIASHAHAHREKFKHLVIGTHSFVTDPKVLGLFQNESFFRVRLPTGPLFHPKTYVFQMDDQLVAVVGSHNLTGRAFGTNIEASMLLRGSCSDPALKELERFVASEWRAGTEIDDEWLYSYKANHRRAARAHRDLEAWVPIRQSKSADSVPGPQDLDWKQYVALLKEDNTHGLEGRLQMLEEVAKLFRKESTFAELDESDRKRIAGTTGRKMVEMDGIDWAWFGAMSASPSFATTVISRPEGLSEALDCIPSVGPVEREDYENFLLCFAGAFHGTRAGGGIATGTRLLAMKRPDQFVCVDGPNKKGIGEHFGRTGHAIALGTYWDIIIEPMRQTAWWLAKRPKDPIESRVWDCRAAMLDAIYYDPDRR